MDASAAVDNDDEYKGPIFRAALNSDALFPQVMSGEDEQHELPCFSDIDGRSASQFENAPHAGASTDVPASRSEVNRALFEARMSSMSDVEIKMPWEQGIMKQIFDSDDDSIFPTVVPPVPAEYLVPVPAPGNELDGDGVALEKPTVKSLVSHDIEMPFYSFAVKVVPDRDIFMEDTMLWDKAIGKWLQVFEVLNFPGVLGAALLAEQIGTHVGAQSLVLRDALGIKSPRTAIKRAQTLLRYFSWLQSSACEWDPWNKTVCLQYVGNIGASDVPASSFLLACQ